MITRSDGGQAFPRAAGPEGGGYCNGELGMTLRDWFAGQALVGIIAQGTPEERILACDYAAAAFQVADAMIQARAQG